MRNHSLTLQPSLRFGRQAQLRVVCDSRKESIVGRRKIGPIGAVITHVVVFWTDKPHGKAQARLLAGARELLSQIPGVVEFRSGVAVPSPRGAVDDSFAVAISMSFPDQASADAYQSHPLHVRFVEEYFKPNSRRFVVYDFG